MTPLALPRNLAAACVDDEDRRPWIDALPATLAAAIERWSLTVVDPFEPGGTAAWVAPATMTSGASCVVKIGYRHPESEHEAAGLRAWQGDGAVQLLDAFDETDAIVLLLERCRPGTTLSDRAETDQDEIIAGLLRRLWRAPVAADEFPSLQQMCDQWADEFEARVAPTPVPIDPGLVRLGITLFRELPTTADTDVLLCTDLHAGNVLAAEREPWLVIDPKPYVGDPTYDALQHLLNCPRRLRTDPDALCRRMATLLDLDVERLRLWLFARCVQESPNWRGLAELIPRIAP